MGRYFLFRETNKMKRFLLGTAALAALCLSIPAFAADLPARVTKAPPALLSPGYNWSGFYLGVSAGYTFAEDEDITTTGQAAGNINNVAIGARPGRVRLERDGFIGGGQMGYNWQVSPNWVFGGVGVPASPLPPAKRLFSLQNSVHKCSERGDLLPLCYPLLKKPAVSAAMVLESFSSACFSRFRFV
jgi:hypothetical protein